MRYRLIYNIPRVEGEKEGKYKTTQYKKCKTQKKHSGFVESSTNTWLEPKEEGSDKTQWKHCWKS